MQYPADVMFAKWFTEQLRWRDLSQAEFARRAGIPQSTVNTWARGSRVPDPYNCDLIADALQMNIDVVLFQAGIPYPSGRVPGYLNGSCVRLIIPLRKRASDHLVRPVWARV